VGYKDSKRCSCLDELSVEYRLYLQKAADLGSGMGYVAWKPPERWRGWYVLQLSSCHCSLHFECFDFDATIAAVTYAVASKLPTVVLDFLLLLPHRLADLRESLQASVDIPPPITAAAQNTTAPPGLRQSSGIPQAPLSESQRTDAGPTPSESESSTYTSEVDGEASTNPSQAPTRANTIAESWVSVNDDE
jgi:hypothetical protein